MEMKIAKESSSQKDTWFRKDGFTSTLTVPATPNSSLAEMVRQNLNKSRQPEGTRTKVIEDGGKDTKAGLVKSNQFPRVRCDRDQCILCIQQHEQKQIQCDKGNVGYEYTCTRCPTKSVYVGESSRTVFTRIGEHMADYRAAAYARLPPQLDVVPPVGAGFQKKKVKSCMWEHTRDVHEGVVGAEGGIRDYKIEVTGTFTKCLPRQVDEDIRMQHYEAAGGVLLNSKHEYYTPKSVQTIFRQQ